jgi:exonuclease VII large subunit
MSVVGIMILITLLLILKLITQPPTDTAAVTTVSARELQEQIESLSSILQEVQNEISQQNQTKLDSIITPQTKNQIDALLTTIERLNTECNEINKEIQNEKSQTENLKKNLKSISSHNDKNQIEQLKEQLDTLKIENDKLTEQEEKLKTIDDELELKLKNQKFENKIVDSIQQLNINVQKKQEKTAYICVYGQDGLTIIPTNGTPQKNFTLQSEFYQWMDSRNKTTEYFVIYFRPSRFERYKDILDHIKNKGFDVGYQVIGETTYLVGFGTEQK